MILWVHSEGPSAFRTLDDAIECAEPGDRIIVTGEFGEGAFSGVPPGKGPLVIEAPDFPAEVYLDEPVLIESPTVFVNINFYSVNGQATLCAQEPNMITLDGCLIENPQDWVDGEEPDFSTLLEP